MQNAVAITKPISYSELAGGQRIDFVQRYVNFIKTKPLMRLVADENALKESIENAQRALQNAQNKDMSSVLNELNDKRARLDEIDIFLGRVEESSPAVERAKARYGDEYKQIIVDKINKESEARGQSDIVFAPQRKNFGIMSNKNDKEYKMKNATELKELMLESKKIINYQKLQEIATPLPAPLSKDEFVKAFAPNTKGRANIQTPFKDIEIKPDEAYEHLLNNSKGEDRTKISGALIDTLKNPLFVTKNKQGNYFFYKPFKDERGILNLVSVEVPKSTRLKYETSYIADKNRMLQLINEYELVYKSW